MTRKPPTIEHRPKPPYVWFWRVYQLGVVVFFLFADVHWEWGAGGLAAGVVGGMIAWWTSAIIGRVLWRMGFGPRFGLEGAPSIELLYRPPDAPPARQKK